eukprot:scaffold76641_cov63-Phaeocystis_antarctica.AAC.2
MGAGPKASPEAESALKASSSFCASASESCVYLTLPSTTVTVARSNLSGVSVVESHVFVST